MAVVQRVDQHDVDLGCRGGAGEEQRLDRLHGGEDSVNEHQPWDGWGVGAADTVISEDQLVAFDQVVLVGFGVAQGDVEAVQQRSEAWLLRRLVQERSRVVAAQVPARVNLSEAGSLGNHCVVAGSSFGWLIQTGPGSAGGWGGLRTKRSGWTAEAAVSTLARRAHTSSARPWWTSAG